MVTRTFTNNKMQVLKNIGERLKVTEWSKHSSKQLLFNTSMFKSASPKVSINLDNIFLLKNTKFLKSKRMELSSIFTSSCRR